MNASGRVCGMGWLRSSRRYCGYLSLAVLALQIILSFGHVHLGAARASSVTAVAGTAVPAPFPTQPGDHSIGYCAICATINLFANSFAPSAPQLIAPVVWQHIEHSDRPAFVFVALRTTSFQSRAPPFARLSFLLIACRRVVRAGNVLKTMRVSRGLSVIVAI